MSGSSGARGSIAPLSASASCAHARTGGRARAEPARQRELAHERDLVELVHAVAAAPAAKAPIVTSPLMSAPIIAAPGPKS